MMQRGNLSHISTILVAILILVLVACGSAQQRGRAAGSSATPPAQEATELPPTQVVESTIPAQPSVTPTQLVEATIPAQPSPPAAATEAPEEEATAAPTSTATATATVPAATAAPTATRSTPSVVVTSEPRVDVWTYGTGVVSTQIEGPLQTAIAFLNSLIVDDTGNSSLAYLDAGLHAEAVANPNDGVVLGIEAAYTSFEVNWLGMSGASSQVEAILIYEGGGQTAHLLDLRRSGDAWQITSVSAR